MTKFLILNQFGQQIEKTLTGEDIETGTINSFRLPSNMNPTAFIKDGVGLSNLLYSDGQAQLFDSNGANGIASLGFHRGGYDALALYWNGRLRTKRNTGEDYLIAEAFAGSWTPNLFPGTHTYGASNYGYFYRVGELLYADFYLHITQKDASASGQAFISMPTTRSNSGAVHRSVATIYSFSSISGAPSGANGIAGRLTANASQIELSFENFSGLSSLQLSNLPSVIGIGGSVIFPV